MDFLDCITEIIAVASGVSETKDCDGLVLEIEVLNVIKERVPVCATALSIGACVPCRNTYDEPLMGVQV